MQPFFKEIDHRETEIGVVSLRARRYAADAETVYEIKLNDEFLMSSQFVASEVALGRLGVAAVGRDDLSVLVGGLGLGYTADAVLADRRVAGLTVVDFLQPVIDWHECGLLPLGPRLTGDPRCRFVRGDFFALSASDDGFDPDLRGRRYDAILVDIDHSPDALLDPRSESFYSEEGLSKLTRWLMPGGVFGLWSNDPPDPAMTAKFAAVFETARAEPVEFGTPYQETPVVQTVYLGVMPA